ncbi:MAG: substrate-binding domain-containing protein [Flavobacteriales bacterium]|uniref:substrate-binding domain-containing protein n=1 Tax=Candidatus Ulvibacter alkanivorans TaxID=2267620 RepID=UPI000DF19FD5|nr:substrate-binding domain-containing protein [Candidatus Ulvibacter alkanivorans]MCH2489069.1 substrate-binding domain-containing protein [Flavobacteriales bacterium]
MTKLHIGGVPEHFNLPWYLTLRDKAYHEKDVNLRWKDYHGGTGQMCKALRSGEIDMAVILTEGIIRDIVEGNSAKIIQVFVKSPLIWGVHVAKNSTYRQVDDLRGTEAAISRYGSGSHLMAYVNAENEGWNMEQDLNFTVVENLAGALQMLPEGNGDYFMWEKFTTKPYVDNGPFRLVGECPTPWPCFVIAVREEVLSSNATAVQSILEIINETTKEFKNIPGIDTMIAERYDQKLEDVRAWLELTEWDQKNLTAEEVNEVQQKLQQLDLINTTLPVEEILYDL